MNEPKRPKVVVVMPAYNAELTLERTVADIPPGSVDEVILVDDCSKDGTVALARRLGLTVIPHERNTGYGGNQKTCYREALARGADVVVMVHPDYQYDPRLVPYFVGYLSTGVCDVMLGSRVRSRAETLGAGMPLWKYVANRVLTTIENVALGQNLADFHSGYRVYTRQVLETIPWEENNDGFVFDSEFLAQAAWFGFRIGDAPVPCRYFDEASSIRLWASTVYGTKTLLVLAKYWLQRLGIGRFGIFHAARDGDALPGGRMNGAAPGAGALSVVVVIARYPPHHLGGYELRCRDVCRELVRRGHRVTVLTSRTGARGVEDDGGVRVVRELHLWDEGVENGLASVLGFAFASGADCRRLRREARRAKADAVAYWHQSGLTSALLGVRPRRGCGVLCDVSSDWLVDAATTGGNWYRVWRRRPGPLWRRAAKACLAAFASVVLRAPTARPDIPPGRAYFTSADRKRHHLDLAIPVEDAAVIRSGIDLALFPFSAERPAGPRTLLFLGRIKRRKGLHTVILALAYLGGDVRLRIVGPPEDEEYLAEVGDLIRKTGVGDRVRVSGPVDHEEVPELLRGVHVLVFPSEEAEAFSRLVLESFAAGTPVVGTTLGGTGDVLREGETGLTHAPGNARELSDQLARIFADDALRTHLAENARALVESQYALGFTVSQIESLLRDAHRRAAPPPPEPAGAASPEAARR